jgi:Flp pilus assembly protein TadG
MNMHFRKEKNRLLKRQEGVVALEFVVLFPLFLLIIAGIVEFGHLFYVRHTLTNASREGARAAVVYVPTDRINWATTAATTKVNEYLYPVVDGTAKPRLPGVTIPAPTVAVSGSTTGSTVTVTITASDVLLVLDKLVTLSNPVTVTAETTMRLE